LVFIIQAVTDWLVEQGLTSHSTQFRSFRSGGIFSNRVIANFIQTVPVKEF